MAMRVVRVCAISTILLLGFAIGEPSAYAQTGEKYGGSLTYAETTSPAELNPYQREAARPVSDRLYTLIYETLVDYNYETEQVTEGLAVDWSTSSEGEDATQITFELREDVQWHDGEPFTAEDVKFTYEYVLGVRAGSNQDAVRRFGKIIESVQADPVANTVTFDLVQGRSNPVQQFSSFWIIPEHKFDDRYLPKENEDPLSNAPVGTGPYEYMGRRIDGNIELSAFDEYWGKRAYIGTTELQRASDPSTMVSGAQSGQIQLIVETPTDQIGQIEQTGRFNLSNEPSLSFHAFAYNNAGPILGKRKVRRALTRATDRASLLQNYYADKGRVLGGPLVPAHPYYNPSVQPREHDPEAARRLLKEAGCVDRDNDGVRETTDGEELSFRLITLKPKAAQSTTRQRVAASYRSQLSDVGVEVEVETKVKSNYQESLFQKRDFDIAWVKWEFDPNYSVSSLFDPREMREGGDNIVKYEDEEAKEIIDKFRSSDDREARREFMNSLQEKVYKDTPYTFLYTVEKVSAISTRVISPRIDPYYFFSYYDNWYIAPGYQK